ncbi:MAG: hypothetical protein BGO74_03525 [Burkholderiales bacterium 68-12]|uniref:hypothetical protein n=1 Tax=Comamonas granuli TaxID=290309 RepID=UPI0005A665DC|nr:hypothetical protein [Comamonas granuli]MCZ2407237.1 hypothetical protein [Burkholderiales bacterium]OJX30554.1 MAG: hypothetical protein BGO74_03525 [Burkholderiales bacterium 68-12]
MRTLKVTIELEMSVPDDWELVQTSEGTPVIRMADGAYLDMAVEPLFAADPEDVWSSTEDEDELNDILDMVDSEAVTYEFATDD